MLYLVDNTFDGQGVSPRELRAALEQLRPDSEIIMERFTDVSPQRIRDLSPSHIFLSGQSHPWVLYSPESLAGIFAVIRDASQPILGVCGGHQQMAMAFGATVGLMKRLTPGEGYEGALRERGFFEVESDCSGLFGGLPRRVNVWHSHYDEVKELPTGFRTTAFSDTCAIQAIQHSELPLFGVQFHPELFDPEHPDGRQIIENFLAQ